MLLGYFEFKFGHEITESKYLSIRSVRSRNVQLLVVQRGKKNGRLDDAPRAPSYLRWDNNYENCLRYIRSWRILFLVCRSRGIT